MICNFMTIFHCDSRQPTLKKHYTFSPSPCLHDTQYMHCKVARAPSHILMKDLSSMHECMQVHQVAHLVAPNLGLLSPLPARKWCFQTFCNFSVSDHQAKAPVLLFWIVSMSAFDPNAISHHN